MIIPGLTIKGQKVGNGPTPRKPFPLTRIFLLLINMWQCHCCCSVIQSCSTLCDAMDCSTPGLPVPHHLPEFAQDHVHGIGDVHPAISSSDALFSFHPWSFLASGTFPMSHLSASDDLNSGASPSTSVLPVNIQSWSSLRLTGLISLLSKWVSAVFSSTMVRRHWFFGILSFLWSNSYNLTWPLGRP